MVDGNGDGKDGAGKLPSPIILLEGFQRTIAMLGDYLHRLKTKESYL